MSDKAIWYKSLDPAEKEKLLSHRAEWYKSLDPKVKEKLLVKSAEWYKSLGSAGKQNLLSSRAIWYKSMDTAQKHKRAEWFNSLNCAQKQKTAERYKSLKKKKNFFLAEQNGIKHWILQTKIRLYHSKEAHRNSAQHDLDHKITAFQTKIRECPYYICSVCNKTLYSKTVIQLEETNAQHSARTIFLTLHHLMKISTFVKPVTQKF